MTDSQDESRRAREVVNEYEDHLQHLRGYYSRTDLLAISKRAWQAGVRWATEHEEELCRRIAAELCKFDIACHVNHETMQISLVGARQQERGKETP